MANTLKFGSGNWATKEGSTLAYNDENGNFKPLPFDFSRDSSATVVNKYGLIEVVGNDIPRIDYKDDAKGALLLEPTRSNYSASSELPSTWTYTEFGSGSAGTITTGKTDMFGGTNAVQVDFPSDAENVSILFGSSSSGLTSGDTSVSIYIKLVESGSKDVQLRCNFTSIVNVNSTEFTRVYLSGTKTSSEAFNLKLRPSAGTSSGGFSIIVCHPQEENGSYATSYIPTQGSVVTRLADSCTNSGNEQVFNGSDGAMFLNFASYGDYVISLDNATATNRIQFFRTTTNDRIYIMIGGTFIINEVYRGTSNGVYNKYALSYESGNILLYVNGSLLRTYTTPFTSTPFTKFRLNQYDNNSSVSLSLIDSKIYNTALTDQELIALTS